MALPTTIVSASHFPGHIPPFKSSTGDFYSVAGQSGANTRLGVYKATDPSDSWTETDTAGDPAQPAIVASAVQSGDVIHIAWFLDSNNIRYSQFNMATDSWDITEETIENPANAPTNPWISIAVESTGVPKVVYAGDTDQVMGGKKERVDVNVRNGGTWDGPVVLSANDTADEHYGNPNIVKASDSDDMHITWSSTTNTSDPPTAWFTTETRTITAADSLSTLDTDVVDTANTLLGIQNGVSFDDSGTEVIRFGMIFSSAGIRGAALMLSDTGTGGKRSVFETTATVEFASAIFSPKVNGEVGIITVAGPDSNGDLHVLWSNADDSDDIYYATSTDTGDTWSAEAQELDAVACNFISANIYVRGIDTVLAYVYDDGGTTKYNEKVIIEGVAGDPQPMIIRSTTVPHTRQWHPRGLRR
jgi:hypothetical protein